MEVITDTKRKARKEHVCDYCNRKIEKGEVYNFSTIINDGEIYNWKIHEICDKIADKLNMYEYPNDDGLTANDFQEILFDFARAKRPDIKSYSEALEFVKNYFKTC